MKKFHTLLLFICCSYLDAQNNHSDLFGTWIFESMTTITNAAREEITIVYKDKNNIETLSFNRSGSIYYNVINEGIQNDGSGVWFAQEGYLTIIVGIDTTYGTYEIEDNALTIITREEETNEYFGFTTILKYKVY
tara:strand:- start:95 stop:499 length:405 start_codon:yes stop_codon:yes gene_type:complete